MVLVLKCVEHIKALRQTVKQLGVDLYLVALSGYVVRQVLRLSLQTLNSVVKAFKIRSRPAISLNSLLISFKE